MKKAKTVLPTQAQLMQEAAQSLRLLKAKIEELTSESDEKKEQIINYMDANGLKLFEGWQLQERIGSVKWEGKSGKALEQIQEMMMGEIDPKYMDTKINAQKLYNSIHLDKSIARLLNGYGVQIVQSPPSVFLKDTVK